MKAYFNEDELKDWKLRIENDLKLHAITSVDFNKVVARFLETIKQKDAEICKLKEEIEDHVNTHHCYGPEDEDQYWREQEIEKLKEENTKLKAEAK